MPSNYPIEAVQNLHTEETLQRGLNMAELFINRDFLTNLSEIEVLPVSECELDYSHIRLYKITKLVYEPNENIHEKLISVYSALANFNSTIILIIRSDSKIVNYYIGVRSPGSSEIAGMILRKSFLGNFPGSILAEIAQEKNEEIIGQTASKNHSKLNKCISAVSIVPSNRMEDFNKDTYVQGLEKFIESMTGEVYTAVIISVPQNYESLQLRKTGYEKLYSTLSPFSKRSINFGENRSQAVSEGISENFTNTVNESISDTTGTNSNKSKTKTSGSSSGFGFFFMNHGRNSSTSNSDTSGVTNSESTTKGSSDSTSKGTNKSETTTKTENWTVTLSQENKTVTELMKKIDEQLIRINQCESFGLWESACYFIANDIQTSMVASSTFKALMAGERSGVENSYINLWSSIRKQELNTQLVLDCVNHGIHPKFLIAPLSGYSTQIVTPGNLISGKELPILMGLPKKSISGVTTVAMAEFGRNVFRITPQASSRKIKIGQIYHMGRKESTEVNLDLDSLTSHCFITGSTGSGKSNTTYSIINELIKLKIPFLVIEPTKGEYRRAFGNVKDINIFCTNPNYHQMLYLNPFEFNKNIHILEHLGKLVEIFNACWPLYAAMPALLKTAFERAYSRCGWDLNNSIRLDNGQKKFPTFRDVLEVLPNLINESSYSADSKGNYIGALVTRVSSLTTGLAGQIFCGSGNSISEQILFDKNCIVDLTHVGSSETQSLIMGILITKLNEYRKAKETAENLPLKHVTILEEAHNILMRISKEQVQESANLQGKSVEMICNSIAEMRTVGEGFFIIDQSPNAVDDTAIKNTNTKIIFKLPSSDDSQSVGRSVGLTEDQIKEISRLETGVAVVYQSNWLEPVLVKGDKYSNNYYANDIILSNKDLKKLKGLLAVEILEQYNDGKFDMTFINTHINKSSLPPYKKDEIRLGIMSYMKRTNNSDLKLKEFNEFLCSFVNAQDLFSIYPLTLCKEGIRFVEDITQEDRKTIESWYANLKKSLEYYVDIDDENFQKLLLNAMIMCQAERHKSDARYDAVLCVIKDLK